MNIKRKAIPMFAVVLVLGLGYLVYRSHLLGTFFGPKYGEPNYEVVEQDGDYEIRNYTDYVVAEITMDAPFGQATNSAFMPLFAYITGANRSQAKIDMTTPVLTAPSDAGNGSEKISMTVPVLVAPQGNGSEASGGGLDGDGTQSWTMGFVLPAEYTLETAPVPTDGRIAIRGVQEHRVASVRYSGNFTNQKAEVHRAKLEAWLAAKGLAHHGDWQLATYDPPFTIPWLRRNEVLVTLQ
jgi:hypothetical protein